MRARSQAPGVAAEGEGEGGEQQQPGDDGVEGRHWGGEQQDGAGEAAGDGGGEQELEADAGEVAQADAVLAGGVGPGAGDCARHQGDGGGGVGGDRGQADQHHGREADEGAAAGERVHGAGEQAGGEQDEHIGRHGRG